MKNDYKWVLASASPRRKEILSTLLSDFEIRVSESEEKPVASTPEETVKAIAASKGLDVLLKASEKEIIIAADTLVFCDGEILGKPKGKADAKRMISLISGRTHYVATGVFVGIKDGGSQEYDVFSEKSEVMVDELSEEEIENYISTDEPYDKAGAYAIQGLFGKHIKGIKGDYYNIVGFPLNAFYDYCKSKGFITFV
ncbi:MAG: septum formation protein Maf [Lachnospiraceae bacterium]|nr:septum formation protein Maf [Lachnospiraceae bacterium]